MESLSGDYVIQFVSVTGFKVFKFGRSEANTSMKSIAFSWKVAGIHVKIKSNVVDSSAMNQTQAKLRLMSAYK